MNCDNSTGCSCGCCEGIEHITPLTVENQPGLSALQYRVGTHSRFNESMLRSISGKKALNALTSRSTDDMAIATLDAWAMVLDVLTFYQERIINEGYLRTATERFSILELAQHISYRPGPGMAASTFLKFSMNESPGAPATAVIPVGTKVQSVPEQNQLPQVFETIEPLDAKVVWNAIKLQTQKRIIPVYGDKEIYLKGINTGLQPGDGLLMIGDERAKNAGNENWDFRKVKDVIPDAMAGHTRITWSRGLGDINFGNKTHPAAQGFNVFALRQRASLFGYNALEWRMLSEEVRNRFLAPFLETSATNTDLDWKDFDIHSISAAKNDDVIHLDAIYPKIIMGSWVVLSRPDYEEVYELNEAVESARKGFGISAKTMALQLKGENLIQKFNDHIRDTVVYAQSEKLEVAEKPVTDAIEPGRKEIRLEKLLIGFAEKKPVIISGKRMRLQVTEESGAPKFNVTGNSAASRYLAVGDSLILLKNPEDLANGKKRWFVKDAVGFEGEIEIAKSKIDVLSSVKDDEMVSELHTIEQVLQTTDPTVLVLSEPVVNYFDPFTVVVYANVAAATHGETRLEVLGSGDGSQRFQKFELKQTPLTYVSAATASGTKTTLQVRVNDILWQEVDTFYGAQPGDKIYVTTVSDNEKVTVQFGDGITGARLPTGIENVRATYRVGIGTPGLLHAGQLSMLMTPQLGVNGVINPLNTAGAADPESRDEARKNAPLTVLTLDRIVSVNDFENFTRAYAGIGKARAEMIWSGERQIVFITIAANDQSQIDKTSDLYLNLRKSIKEASHSNSTVEIENYKPVLFSVQAGIKVDRAYLFEDVRKKVMQLLNDTFSFSARNFGQDVTPAEIIATIQTVEGVLFTRLQLLNGINPFAQQHFRLQARLPMLQADNHISSGELLIIDPNEIHITPIVS